jgi:hypothetical protein
MITMTQEQELQTYSSAVHDRARQAEAERDALRAAARALACAIVCEHGGSLDASVATLAGPDVPSRMTAPLRALLALLPPEAGQ